MGTTLLDGVLAELDFEAFGVRGHGGPSAVPAEVLLWSDGLDRSIEVASGPPMRYRASGVWLRCADSDGRQLMVCSFRPEPGPPVVVGPQIGPEGEAALTAAGKLEELTRPVDRSTGQVAAGAAGDLGSLVSRFVLAQARDWRRWAPATWRADGAAVAARTWSFAGASCGFAVIDGIGVACAGTGAASGGVDLVTIRGNGQRRDDRSDGIPLAELNERLRHAAPPLVHPARWHADQLALLAS